MVKCVCIDDEHRPREIPKDKWIQIGYKAERIIKTLNENGESRPYYLKKAS